MNTDRPDAAMTQPLNVAQAHKPTWREKLCHRLGLQPTHADWPKFDPTVAAAGDGIAITVTTSVSIPDRVRILFAGRCATSVRVVTQNPLGAHLTNSAFSVLPPVWMDAKPKTATPNIA